MATEKDTPTATREAASKARTGADEIAQAVESTTRKAAESARNIGDEAADTARTAAQAGADTGRRTLETAAGVTRQGVDAANQMAGTAAAQFQKLMGFTADNQGEVAKEAQQNLDAMVKCGSVLMDGWQTIMREWMGMAQEAATRNAEGVNALVRSRSVRDFYVAQSNLVKDNVELLLNRSVKVSELSAKSANDAVRRLKERTDAAAQQTARF
ncbi:phasin family protein [Azospirillum thermophilum]|uniref:Phasin domain-containing protein n=1 Tax=Azospirillum thermophilum TaxID=2202148 RepID=A0A2S2CRN0_9PROT|nr:phasin family protein [Azospirillum thermophilum]AWK87136.1 hypothetical protein DEW08_13690 [Azospirillum thermophilum]